MVKSGPGIKKNNDNIIYSIGSLYVLLNQYFSAFLKPYQLTPAKFNILFLAKNLGGIEGASQTKIGEDLFVSAANITKLIDSLEKMKLVERKPSPEDRRVNLVKITGKGLALLDEIWPMHVGALNALLNDYKEKDKELFKNYLENLIKDVKEKI